MKRKLFSIIFTVILTVLAVFIVGNNYQMTEKKVIIHTKSNELSAVMTFPKNQKIKGFIFYVHGDGAQNATQDDGYKPLMERFARQGFVSVSWDKPGVGNSKGNWLHQSMDDRAKEVSDVINWVNKKYPNSKYKIGLWGASQAGWVVPKVMKQKKKIDFALLVAPAVNVVQQGAYYTGWQAKEDGATIPEIKKAKTDFINDGDLIEKFSTYKAYKAHGGTESLGEDRYIFVRKMLNEDATNDLSKIRGNVGLILAENDKNVDSLETKKVYAEQISSKLLSVKTIPNVEHRMINPNIAQNELMINVVAVMYPKYYLVDKNYLNYCEKFVSDLDD